MRIALVTPPRATHRPRGQPYAARVPSVDVLDRNVGGRDRRLRAVLAVVLGVVAAVAAVDGVTAVAVASGAGALGAGFNAVTGWCGVNAACGFDTTGE